MQYQAEQADPEPTKEVSEDLDNEGEPEPHYHDYNTKAETHDTTVRESFHHKATNC